MRKPTNLIAGRAAKAPTLTTDQLLAERGKTHGDYLEHAACTQEIMRVYMAQSNWDKLPDAMKESLHMNAHKAGRILTGDPFINDHWDDTAGYSRLISKNMDRIKNG